MTRIQTTVQPPAAPAPPALPEGVTFPAGSPAAQVFQTTQLVRPMTRADYQALLQKKTELSNQLQSAQSRRNDVARALRSAQDGPSKTGLEQRLGVLDNRLAQLETDIAANGRALAAAPAAIAGMSSSGGPGNWAAQFSPGQLTGISIVFILAVLMPVAIAMARSIFKRTPTAKPSPQLLESSARLERMEQAIDTIAIEVERISEGQRFVTQLMAQKEPALLEQSPR